MSPSWSVRFIGGLVLVGAVLLTAVTIAGRDEPPRAPPIQVADRYASTPVVVGPLWDGLVRGEPITALPASVLDQPSGLAASRANPSVLYVQSEKDRRTMVAVSAVDGEVLGKYQVKVPNAYDTEDLAVGPCPEGTCVFIGDIGAFRADVSKPNGVMSVVRIPEPDVAGGQASGTLEGDYFPFVYPGRARKDSEAVMVHPRTGTVYVITKTVSGTSEVFAYPRSAKPGVTSTLVKVADLTLPKLAGDDGSVAITAAAVHPAGTRFAVRTYRAVYEFRGAPGGGFKSGLAAEPVALTDTAEDQGEALDYAADGSAYFTLSESAAPPYVLKRVDAR